jgi:uncharacterized membrane protein YgdD (TMEM256/DUF423 family)
MTDLLSIVLVPHPRYSPAKGETRMIPTRWIGIGAFLLMIAVIIGAFGAHGLRGRLDGYALQVYEKAVFYHVTHAIGIILVGLMAASGVVSGSVLSKVCLILFMGIIFFSGSLYLLAVTGIRWLGAITPIGGTAFIIAWGYLAWITLFSSK